MSARFLTKISFFLICIVSSIANAKGPASIVSIKKWQTQAGMPVFYVHEPELPMVDIQVVFDAGSSRDGNQPGLAKITNEALNAGTKNKTVDQLAAVFDDVGAKFSTAVSRDMAVIALRTLTDDQFFGPAFNTFSEVLSEASFPRNEVLRIQKQTLNLLEEQEEQPSTIAAKAFYNAVFDNNPYGHPISGTKESVAKFTPENLQDFYKKLYTANNGLIAIVGDIDEAKAHQLAEKLSSQLNKGDKIASLSYKVEAPGESVKHITFPSSQTHVLIGQTGIDKKDPAYFPIMVGNYILGGSGLTSRLFDEVREKRGLAYTVRSQFSALKDKGPFIIELQTRNSEANNAIKVVNNTVDNFVKMGPSQQELTAAKQNLTQGFILRLVSNSAIVAQLVNIGFYNLPLDYLDTYQSNIAKVTDEEVKKVFQTLINPSKLTTVTVGNSTEPKNVQSKG